MQQPIIAPTPEALADLVARCTEINRFEKQLTKAEETRISALASGILVMRSVLQLPEVPPERLPVRQSRFRHWMLTPDDLSELFTPEIKPFRERLVLDEHGQVKIVSGKAWRGAWREVALWRDGVQQLSAHDLMEYLVALTIATHDRAPDAARALLERSRSVAAARALPTPDVHASR
jgi:hypothetical protein